MAAPTKPHWLAPGGKTRTPNVVVTFDTETSETQGEGRTVQRLRCWDALVRVRKDLPSGPKSETYHQGERAAPLADVVEAASLLDSEVWVVAHNVSFDLAVTSLPFLLSEREWRIEAFHLGDESTWWVFAKDGRKVVITDSWSWLRCSLADAAKDIGRRKVALPSADDDLARWHARCKRDVQILDEIMGELMAWWEREQLGVFGITGAACGWRAMRRHVKSNAILVGPDGDRTAFERRAIFGGLKEVFGVGMFHDTWMADYDFVSAYPTVCAAHRLPVMPVKQWTSSRRLLDNDPPPERDYVAEVEITTHRPCAPCRIGDEVFHPVGTFRTVLSGPEVRYAATVADKVTVLSHRAYKVRYALADWAGWCIGLQNDISSETPAVVKRVAKGWGRSVVGRFASRTSRVIATRPSTHLGWHLETGHDLDTGVALEWLSMGGVEQTIAKDVDGGDVFPAVLAFVEGHCRIALRQMMDSRPQHHLLQCNTDGWWEMRAISRSDHVPEGVPWPFRLTRKALERRLLVRGPNHILTPHERRYAGIPSSAVDGVANTMHWHDWPGLRWQLEHGEVGEYHRPEREAEMALHYVKRWVLDSGETVPVTTVVDRHGDTAVEPWCRSWGQRLTDVLAPYQVPTLMAVNESDRELGDVVPDDLPIQPGRDFPMTPRGGRVRVPDDQHDGIDPEWSFATKQIILS